MNRLQKATLITSLASELLKRGSWCGETHLQKTVYFLQELLGVPTGFHFVMYKHGPFSFELRDELTEMRADGLFDLISKPFPYGPSLVPTKQSEEIRNRYPRTLKRYEKAIEFVADNLGGEGVTGLERLVSALYVTKERPTATPKARALRMRELKPHISDEESDVSVARLDKIANAARPVKEGMP